MTTLNDIRAAMADRDIELARKHAAQYVDDHPAEFEIVRELTREQCLQAYGVFKDAGHDDDMWRIETWLLYAYPPQRISGEMRMEIKLPQFGLG